MLPQPSIASMKPAFYITTYNDPGNCSQLLDQFDSLALLSSYDCFLSDQSDDQHAPAYASLAEAHGFRHLRNVNQGASAAKRRIVEHAAESGYEFMAQVSEDFALLDATNCQPWLPAGTDTFLHDAHHLLLMRPELTAVYWTFSMCSKGSHFWLWSRERSAQLRLDRLPGMGLAYAHGEVALSNWPYTARVQAMRQSWERARSFKPVTERQHVLMRDSGGEFGLSLVSMGQAAALLANPVGHRDRAKPAGSLP